MVRRSACNRLPGVSRPLKPHPVIPSFIETSMVPARSTLPENAIARRMASDMRDAAYREGGVSRQDLLLLGYTTRQIDTHADAARQLADQGAALT